MKGYSCIVVGAGPAGVGAAIAASQLGVKVLIIDENKRPGGQLFKKIQKFFGSKDHHAGIRGFNIGENLLNEALKLGVEIKLNTKVWGAFSNGVLVS